MKYGLGMSDPFFWSDMIIICARIVKTRSSLEVLSGLWNI